MLHGLGKSDDVDAHLLRLEALAHRLQARRHRAVVEALARLGVDIKEVGADKSPAQVPGDEAAADGRLEDVLADLGEVLRRAAEIGRDDVAPELRT